MNLPISLMSLLKWMKEIKTNNTHTINIRIRNKHETNTKQTRNKHDNKNKR